MINNMEDKRPVFRRKIYDRMLKWKQEESGRTALLIEGARRIGKSTVAEEFGRNEYESCLLIDFSKASKRLPSTLWPTADMTI